MDHENIESKALAEMPSIKIERPAQNKNGEKNNSTESVSDTPSNGNEEDTLIVSETSIIGCHTINFICLLFLSPRISLYS